MNWSTVPFIGFFPFFVDLMHMTYLRLNTMLNNFSLSIQTYFQLKAKTSYSVFCFPPSKYKCLCFLRRIDFQLAHERLAVLQRCTLLNKITPLQAPGVFILNEILESPYDFGFWVRLFSKVPNSYERLMFILNSNVVFSEKKVVLKQLILLFTKYTSIQKKQSSQKHLLNIDLQ